MPHGVPEVTGADATGERFPMSVGAVARELRAEFPGTTVSTIRFFEAEGLVVPGRSASGHRLFGPREVERLRRVLRLRRDECLSLSAIEQRFQEEASRPGGAAPVEPADDAAAPAYAGDTARMGRAGVLAAAGAGEEQLADWEAYGLLDARPDGSYAPAQAAVARLAAELGGYGLQARHLRAVKIAAERQTDLVASIVAPLRRHPDARTRARAERTAEEIAALSVRLHAAFVRSSLGPHGD